MNNQDNLEVFLIKHGFVENADFSFFNKFKFGQNYYYCCKLKIEEFSLRLEAKFFTKKGHYVVATPKEYNVTISFFYNRFVMHELNEFINLLDIKLDKLDRSINFS